eukprot:6194486-Pleurochrysis_carterae.AAC.2
MEIMQLGKHADDELKAENGAPAGQEELHKGRIRAAGSSSKGNKERHPSIGHSHRGGGEVRDTAQGGASLRESRVLQETAQRRQETAQRRCP